MSKNLRLPRDSREATSRAGLEWLLAMHMTNGLAEVEREAEHADQYDREAVLRAATERRNAQAAEKQARANLVALIADQEASEDA